MTESRSQTHAVRRRPVRALPGLLEAGPRGVRVGVAALAAGAGLGVGDLLAQRFVAYPWADLANSPVVWAAAAFLIGWWVRSPSTSAVAGVVMLLIAVLSYYLTAAAVLGDDVADAVGGAAWFWYAGAVVAGGVAGPAGALCRSPVSWQVSCGAAVVPALLIAEASFHVEAVLAAVAAGWTLVTLGVLIRRRGTACAARAVVAIVVLAVAARAAFSIVGLHGLNA